MTTDRRQVDLSTVATKSRRWTHVLIAMALVGCARPPVTFDAVAEGYVRVSLQLAQHDATLVEGWRGTDAWRPGPRIPVASVLDRIEALRRELDRAPAPQGSRARRDYLAGQLRALHFSARRLLGESAGIDDQASDEFGVAFSRVDPARIAAVHADIDEALAGPGPLADRFQRLKAGTIIPADRRQSVMKAALAACRGRATAVLPLPATERVTLAFSRGLGWDGYARYAGGHRTNIEINDDAPLDLSRAIRLACHEGYPGHHVQNLLIDELSWPELELSPGFGPHLLFTEGAAEAGTDLAISETERVSLIRGQLMPLAGLPVQLAGTLVHVESLVGELLPVVTDVARQYLDGRLSRERALERLRNEALVSNPDGTLALIERRRARALVYGEGRLIVNSKMPDPSLTALHRLFTSAITLQ